MRLASHQRSPAPAAVRAKSQARLMRESNTSVLQSPDENLAARPSTAWRVEPVDEGVGGDRDPDSDEREDRHEEQRVHAQSFQAPDDQLGRHHANRPDLEKHTRGEHDFKVDAAALLQIRQRRLEEREKTRRRGC
jgi:hypothetical protein